MCFQQTQTFSNVLLHLFRHSLLPFMQQAGCYSNKHMLLFASDGVYFFSPRSCLDTMLKSTTTACLSWNRPLTRLLGASSAPSSLTCLKKLSTCWCIMTGRDASNICSLRCMHSNTHPNKNVYKLVCWGIRMKTSKTTQSFLHIPIHTMSIHTELYLLYVLQMYIICNVFWTDLRCLLTMKTILNARRKSMLSTRYGHEKRVFTKGLLCIQSMISPCASSLM